MKYQKRFAMLMVLLVLTAFYKFQAGDEMMEEVEEFRGANIKKDVFNPMIATSVNSKLLTVNLNDQEYTNQQSDVYMSEQLNIMVPKEILVDGLDCSARVYKTSEKGKDILLILQGDNKISMDVDGKTMKVNGEKKKITESAHSEKGTVFVPLQVLQEELNFKLDWDLENNEATAKTKKNTKVVPTTFDLREYGRMTEVKDQGDYGTCWAFASLSALESSLLPKEYDSFSVDHMSRRNSFSSDLTVAGEYTMGMAYLTSWQGPVWEKDDPYGDHKSPEGLAAVKHVQEIQLSESGDAEEIKEAVFKYGAAQTSLYFAAKNSIYFDETNSAYYYNGVAPVNHDVVIIGWDDNYKKENFYVQPQNDGAFICQNSWGKGFGENGIFYVSYEDANIGSHIINYTGIEEPDNYQHIYQSDLCGWGGRLGYNKDSLYAANVFTPGEDEVVEAAGFYATGKNTSYELYVVPLFDGVSSLNEGYLVAQGSKKKAGFYTVKFDSGIQVTKGRKFAVVLKITTPDSQRPLAVEYDRAGSNVKVDLTDGESYISASGNHWKSAEETQNCNICLKAYTNNKE
ncbi:MAG: cell surface protein [Lachnospiraceae bacterium]|nr:cell surface protein [Lachnospiraceae bacterium]